MVICYNSNKKLIKIYILHYPHFTDRMAKADSLPRDHTVTAFPRDSDLSILTPNLWPQMKIMSGMGYSHMF